MSKFGDFIKKQINKAFVEPAVTQVKKDYEEQIKQRDQVISKSLGMGGNLNSMAGTSFPLKAPMNFQVPSDFSAYNTMNRKYGGRVDFTTLRQFSEVYDVARACIQKRKRQITRMRWSVVAKDKKQTAKFSKQADNLITFFQQPGGKNTRFREFCDKMVEDILVLDAVCLWKDKSKKGDLIKYLNVDAATIRLKIYTDGSTPEPPDKAYEQIILGKSVGEWTTEEMIYDCMNPRTHSPYGFSPLEAFITGIDAALRSQLSNLDMLTEGNIPEGFWALPKEWKPQQIQEFQEFWDSLVAGNPRFQQRMKFMPGGEGTGFTPAKKPEDMRFQEYEMFLLKKMCALMDMQPQELGFTEKINRATGETQMDIGIKSGVEPMANFLKEIFDMIIRDDFGIEDLEFKWLDIAEKDQTASIERLKALIPLGVIGPDEAREEEGMDPIGLGPYVMTAAGPILVKDILTERPAYADPVENTDQANDKPVKQEEQQVEELYRWMRKATKDFKEKRDFRSFKSEVLDGSTVKIVSAKLGFAKSREDIRSIFTSVISEMKNEIVAAKAWQLKNDIEQITAKDYELTPQT